MEQHTRSKDGVPVWNGEASSFQAYEEQALLWEQGVPWHKRCLCGPRLVSELTGTARRHIIGKKPDWVSFQGGVQHLLSHLRQALGRPQISDMTDHLNKYFKSTRRRKMESMNDYITRKTEAYARAKQAYGRVEDEHAGRRRSTPMRDDRSWDEHSWRREWWSDWGRDSQTNTESQGQDQDDEEEEWYDAEGAADGDSWSGSWWGSQGAHYGSWRQHEDEHWTHEVHELLPDFVQGWYLLQDATLGANEKNVVMTALRGDYGLNRVAQELRNQWPEEDLKRYDQGHRQSNLWNDEAYYENDEEDGDWAYYDYDTLVKEGMNQEGLALMGNAEEEAEEAYNMIQQGKQTLKEARFKQHQVKMSRQYYRPSSYGGKSKGKGKSSSSTSTTCLRCGGGHRTSDCPDKAPPRSQANQAEEAPFVCFTENKDTQEKAYYQMSGEACPMSTHEAVEKGMGIIDGGATRTLGSVYALEKLMAQNVEKHGENRILGVDPDNTPTFGFGNSSKDKCLSTTQVGIRADDKPGVLQVHTLDKGTGPILVSVHTLRQLGALIDFSTNLAVFRNLDRRKVVPLVQSASGHQMVSLSDDLYKDAKVCAHDIPSLSELI